MKKSNIILPNFDIEDSYNQNYIIGIDEAGRGPLAGPVVASCVLVGRDLSCLKRINDSKKISKKNRKEIYNLLIENTKFAIGVVDEKTIDEINILNATKLAMKKAVVNFIDKYQINPRVILVDGNFIPFNKNEIKNNDLQDIIAIIKGDQKSLSIAAASIIAKETRDNIMLKLSQEFSHYLWDRNSGYGTKGHIKAIKKHGISIYHRKSFEPIKSMIK